MSEQESEVYWYLHTTADQQKCVLLLSDELKQQGVKVPDELVLKRFLRARKWEVDRAKAMYIDMLAFRESKGVDSIVSTFDYKEAKEVNKSYKRFYHKTDKYGRPVYIELLGDADVTTMMQVTTLDRFINHHIQRWEHFEHVKLPACSKAAGKPILSTVAILDLEGLSMWHFTFSVKEMIQSISRIDQDYYPEHLGAMYIINAPFIFRSIWSFVKPLLDEGTAAKVHVLGADYQPILADLIPLENLWSRFGGKSVVTDHTDEGPWV